MTIPFSRTDCSAHFERRCNCRSAPNEHTSAKYPHPAETYLKQKPHVVISSTKEQKQNVQAFRPLSTGASSCTFTAARSGVICSEASERAGSADVVVEAARRCCSLSLPALDISYCSRSSVGCASLFVLVAVLMAVDQNECTECQLSKRDRSQQSPRKPESDMEPQAYVVVD